MKKSFLLLLIIFALFLAIFGNRFLFPPDEVRAQQPSDELLDRRVETFFNNLEQSSVSAAMAFENLFRDDGSSTTTSRTSLEAVEEMGKKFIDLTNSEIGRMQGRERISTKPVGKDVVLLKYLTKHDNAPVAWSFTFYRPPRTNTGWSLIRVRFDTDPEWATY